MPELAGTFIWLPIRSTFFALGEPELGFAPLYAGDNTLTDEVGKGEIDFKCTQTDHAGRRPFRLPLRAEKERAGLTTRT
jgi:hypothetical protein